MVKHKKLKLSLIALLSALIIALGAALVSLNMRGSAAFADDRYVTLDGNSVFYTSIRGAQVGVGDEVTEGGGEEAETKRYTQFTSGSEQEIAYRQNLAYVWLTGSEDGSAEQYTEKKFSMELYFPEINFKRYYIKFESQQNVLTKDGKSENYLVFSSGGSGADKTVQVSVSETIEETEGQIEGMVDIGAPYKANEHIRISFGDYVDGDYVINLEGVATDGKFVNVYEKYASYVASGDNAVTPLTFGAVFEGDGIVETDSGAKMALVEINGQSFEMHKSGDDYKVKDTAAPVICFSQTPSYLEYNKTIGFQYKVIDVLASSPRATAYYYVLTGEQAGNVSYDYDKTDYTEDTSDSSESEGENKPEKQENPFIKVTSSSGIKIVTDSETFIPSKYLKSDVKGLVKIYYELSDVSSTSTAKTDKVFIDWYVKEEKGVSALENVYDYNSGSGTSFFLRLIEDKKGATYARQGDAELSSPLTAYKASVKAFEENYQNAIDKAIAESEDGKLYAGGNKFYIPAIESGFKDKEGAVSSGWFLDDYLVSTDYKYSIYYKGSSSGSHSSLASNQLAIELNDADVTYTFTVLISDNFGNPMRYPTDEVDDNGEVVWKEITSADVWDEEFSELLPFFNFEVSYKEATAEPPESLSLAYVGTSYSGVSFKITGVSQTYTSTYKLYVFDRNKYYNDNGEQSMDYATFVSKTGELLKTPETRTYFTTVKPVSELLESDENYDMFKSLNWNATSVTFTPQEGEYFYVVELKLTDNRSQNFVTEYATVEASMQTNSLKGESDWLGNNKTSVILFVVAGVCLVALVIILVIKPKDKGDIDAIYSEVEGEKPEKAEKAKKKNRK
ncbi:MAG: hypothetical protein NC131_02870 [Roseburia sp.]|nr:hypothetical protein [Roseburia sp.]